MPPIATPRVSVCVPYWNRRAALVQMLDDLQSKYGSDERWLEVSICDDGSGREKQSVWSIVRPDLPDQELIGWPGLSFRISALTEHNVPRCSALAINVAVESSTAPVIVIQNPETTHRSEVVIPTMDALIAAHPRAYVVASCLDTLTKQWYEHPVHRPKNMHWCVGMKRDLWQEFGGIDLGLMVGHCYEDNDLRNRAHRAGAIFTPREDLVVEHHKSLQEKYVGRSGRADHWDQTLVAKNRLRYLKTWGQYWPDHGGDGE